MNPVAASIQGPMLMLGNQVVNQYRDITDLLCPLLAPLEVEYFCAIALDSSGKIIESAIISIGTDMMTLAPPKVLFRWALTRKAMVHSIFVAHNHPSGNPQPSDEDIALTGRLVNASNAVGIVFNDHLVVGGDRAISIRNMQFVT